MLDNSAATTASIHPGIVPPLQPGEGTNGNTGNTDENLFPVPAANVLAGVPPIIEHVTTIGPESDADFAVPPGLQFESDCNMEPDATNKSRCNVSPPQEE